jgi:hypothetical protein
MTTEGTESTEKDTLGLGRPPCEHGIALRASMRYRLGVLGELGGWVRT